MSHELRTPLNAIIGYSEILAEDATDRGDDASVRDLQKIQSAGKHLLGLINSVLDLSKIEAGRMDVYLEQVNLAQLVDEVRVMVQPLVEKNGNRLVIDCPSGIGAMRTDLTKIKQSLINLLSNAAKFTEKGEVGLSVARQDAADGRSHVVFKVSDSGIGMTEEQMGRLFEAFAQAEFLDHPEFRRHGPRPRHHQALRHPARRHGERDKQARPRLDLHPGLAGPSGQRGDPGAAVQGDRGRPRGSGIDRARRRRRSRGA